MLQDTYLRIMQVNFMLYLFPNYFFSAFPVQLLLLLLIQFPSQQRRFYAVRGYYVPDEDGSNAGGSLASGMIGLVGQAEGERLVQVSHKSKV